MKILTAIGNEIINKKIKEKNIAEVIGQDIQYQEAVIEILEKNKDIDILILSAILPGEYNIYELINIIKYKNKKIKIIIFLENKENKIIEFLITKEITDIYINNEITTDEIINRIIKLKNKEEKIEEILETKKIEKNKNIKKELIEKIIKIIKKLKTNKKNKKTNNKINNKIFTIIGARKIGKTIFCLLLSLNIKNKKILIIDFNFEKNDTKIIIGKKIKNKNGGDNRKFEKIKWRKNVDIIFIKKECFETENHTNKKTILDLIGDKNQEYDYIIIDLGETNRKTRNFKRKFKNYTFSRAKPIRDK